MQNNFLFLFFRENNEKKVNFSRFYGSIRGFWNKKIQKSVKNSHLNKG